MSWLYKVSEWLGSIFRGPENQYEQPPENATAKWIPYFIIGLLGMMGLLVIFQVTKGK